MVLKALEMRSSLTHDLNGEKLRGWRGGLRSHGDEVRSRREAALLYTNVVYDYTCPNRMRDARAVR